MRGDVRGGLALGGGGAPTLADEVAHLRAEAVTFDASTEVGTLPGRSGVTPTGQAVYSIPLDVAPGIGEMTPALSLEYRSTPQNGVLGVGFSLGGVAAPIRRCDRTHADDGVNERFAQSEIGYEEPILAKSYNRYAYVLNRPLLVTDHRPHRLRAEKPRCPRRPGDGLTVECFRIGP